MYISNMENIRNNNDCKIKYYKCCSMKLGQYLIENNHVPIKSTTARNGKLVYIFVQCDTLSMLLTEWTKDKKKQRSVRNGK